MRRAAHVRRELDPARGAGRRPYFGKLDPDARYYVKIDNTGDGRPDVAYRWEFDQRFRNPTRSWTRHRKSPARRSGHQLHPDLRPLPRTIAARRAREADRERLRSRPTNVGPKTIPTTNAAQAIGGVAGGGKSFVGPVDDPFFVDLGAVFDGINIDKPGRPNIGLGNQGGGRDDVSGYNTHRSRSRSPSPR